MSVDVEDLGVRLGSASVSENELKDDGIRQVRVHHRIPRRSHRIGKRAPRIPNDRNFAYLNEGSLIAELEKCLNCVEKPCMNACPVSCDPSYFITAARGGTEVDLKRAAAHIMKMSPFGGTCGVVCPDKFCMAACSRRLMDKPIEIPAVQATLVRNARDCGLYAPFEATPVTHPDDRIAVVGAGPSGLAMTAVLVRHGYPVTIFEARHEAGGLINTIPSYRLPPSMLTEDIAHALRLGTVEVKWSTRVDDPEKLLVSAGGSFAAVAVCVGTHAERKADFVNEDSLAISALDFLWNPDKHKVGDKVVVIGGGAVSIDCATTAKAKGAKNVTLVYRRGMSEMPLSRDERQSLFNWDIDLVPRTRVLRLVEQDNRDGDHDSDGKVAYQLSVCRVDMPPRESGERWSRDEPGSESVWSDISKVIVAVGLSPHIKADSSNPRVFYAGDVVHGASTVVEAAGFGKNIGEHIHNVLTAAREGKSDPKQPESQLSWEGQVLATVPASPFNFTPVSLATDFFGIFTMINPFILSASPLTDGIDRVRAGYDAGWGGAVFKTAFHNLHIHIPAQYMDWMGADTGFNADNVSAHTLERVCAEIKIIRKEYPDRLTLGGTGGPVTGDDEFDRAGWQQNTIMLQEAGAMAVEYSLSCPQGGDGTEGSIVSQNARATAKVVDWVMQVSDPKIPKLFKLTGAVTSIAVIVSAVYKVLNSDAHKDKLAGITLANSFPSMMFRDMDDEMGNKRDWEQGIVFGMSGKGVLPISYLTIAEAANIGVPISGNGGIMHHRDAANFLALGCKTVQLCTLPYKAGFEVIHDLCAGLSLTMQERRFESVAELIGSALPEPIRDFMDLTPIKKISSCDTSTCISCGNCVRCPYGAIKLNADGHPEIDASLCIGCGFCVLNCPTKSLAMRVRTSNETKLMEMHHGPEVPAPSGEVF